MTTQFISLDRLATLLGMTDNHKARETVRRLTRDGIISKDDFRSHLGPKMAADFRQHSLQKVSRVTTEPRVKDRLRAGLKASNKTRGRPAVTYFLSPVGALTLAMHVRTPEAAAWRRAQVEKLAGGFVPALPAHEPSPEVIEEVQDLQARVARLEARVSTPLARRAMVDDVAAQAAFVAAFERLQTAVNGKGLTAAQIVELANLGHVAAVELYDAIRVLNGGTFPATVGSLGKFLQRHDVLESRWAHGHVRRWVVAGKGVH